MRTGDLRRRISIQQRSQTLDAFGQQSLSWVDVLSDVPAAIESISGLEKLFAMQVQSPTTHTVTVRWHPQLADLRQITAWRIVYRDGTITRYFNIEGAANIDERRRWIELKCTEGLSEG